MNMQFQQPSTHELEPLLTMQGGDFLPAKVIVLLGLTVTQRLRKIRGCIQIRQPQNITVLLSLPPPSIKEEREIPYISGFVTNIGAESIYLSGLNTVCGPCESECSGI